MAEIISFMKQYNERASEGEDLPFYGADMQRTYYSFQFLNEACKELDVDTNSLEKLMGGKNWSGEYDNLTKMEIIDEVKNELKVKKDSTKAIYFTDMLIAIL